MPGSTRPGRRWAARAARRCGGRRAMRSRCGEKIRRRAAVMRSTTVLRAGRLPISPARLSKARSITPVIPYRPDAVAEGAGVTTTLPAVQPFGGSGTFAAGISPMTARSTRADDLRFTSVCGVVRLQLTGTATIRSIRLTALDGAPLAGRMRFEWTAPAGGRYVPSMPDIRRSCSTAVPGAQRSPEAIPSSSVWSFRRAVTGAGVSRSPIRRAGRWCARRRRRRSCLRPTISRPTIRSLMRLPNRRPWRSMPRRRPTATSWRGRDVTSSTLRRWATVR